MVGLYAQRRDNAVFDFIVLFDTGAVLLVNTVKKLATVFTLTSFKNHEMTVFCLPVQTRHWSQLTVMGVEANLTIDELSLDLFLDALREGALHGPDLAIGKIGDFFAHFAVLR